jgi:hypothetical protein
MSQYSNILCIHSDLDGISSEILSQYFNLPFDKTVSYDYDYFNDPEKLRIFFDADNIVFSDISPNQYLYDSRIQPVSATPE